MKQSESKRIFTQAQLTRRYKCRKMLFDLFVAGIIVLFLFGWSHWGNFYPNSSTPPVHKAPQFEPTNSVFHKKEA